MSLYAYESVSDFIEKVNNAFTSIFNRLNIEHDPKFITSIVIDTYTYKYHDEEQLINKLIDAFSNILAQDDNEFIEYINNMAKYNSIPVNFYGVAENINTTLEE